MKYISIIIVTMLLSFSSLKAQNDLSFYHMGKSVPQGNHMNPSFFPNADFYISLPGISGIQMSMNNSFGYEDIFTDIPNSESVLFDVDKLLGTMENGDFLEFNANISLLQLGFKIGDNSFITIFANERVSAGMVYPLDLLKFAWGGNQEYVGTTFTESDFRVSANYFREIGVGYSRELLIMGDKKLRVGLRLKSLQGIVNVNSSENFSINVFTDEERFDMNISVNDPVFYTAGIESLEEDANAYILSNSNKGLGIDLGAEFELNEKINLSLAINDIGSISWKEDVKNYTVNNTEINYEGLDLKDTNDLGGALEDSLSNKFDDDTNFDSYKTSLDTRTFIGGTYQVIQNGLVSASISNKFFLGKATTTFGVGYTHQFGNILTLSTTIAKKARQKPSFGGGFAVRFGFFQLYTSVDNFFGYVDAAKIKKMDVRFGMNFMFGRRKEAKKPTEFKPKDD